MGIDREPKNPGEFLYRQELPSIRPVLAAYYTNLALLAHKLDGNDGPMEVILVSGKNISDYAQLQNDVSAFQILAEILESPNAAKKYLTGISGKPFSSPDANWHGYERTIQALYDVDRRLLTRDLTYNVFSPKQTKNQFALNFKYNSFLSAGFDAQSPEVVLFFLLLYDREITGFLRTAVVENIQKFGYGEHSKLHIPDQRMPFIESVFTNLLLGRQSQSSFLDHNGPYNLAERQGTEYCRGLFMTVRKEATKFAQDSFSDNAALAWYVIGSIVFMKTSVFPRGERAKEYIRVIDVLKSGDLTAAREEIFKMYQKNPDLFPFMKNK